MGDNVSNNHRQEESSENFIGSWVLLGAFSKGVDQSKYMLQKAKAVCSGRCRAALQGRP